MPERRIFPRTDLKVYARGYVTLGGGQVFPFGAMVTNLSEGGAKLVLNQDSMDRFNRMDMVKDNPAAFDNSPVRLDLISYVQDNARVTGRVAHTGPTTEGVIFGVEFGELDEDARVGVRHVIEAKPELEMMGDNVLGMERNFSSMGEFIVELTAYCINSGKEEMFRISGELFKFVGMHISPSGDSHLDLIESQEHPGKIFCPDCKAYIDTGSML